MLAVVQAATADVLFAQVFHQAARARAIAVWSAVVVDAAVGAVTAYETVVATLLWSDLEDLFEHPVV